MPEHLAQAKVIYQPDEAKQKKCPSCLWTVGHLYFIEGDAVLTRRKAVCGNCFADLICMYYSVRRNGFATNPARKR